MLHIRITRGPNREETLSISDKELPFTIGREKDNRLHIRSNAVSRYHAVLLRENGEHYVQDMNSTNGTLLNGKKTKKGRVNPGDKITIANVEIRIEGAPAPLQDTKVPLDLTVSIDRPISMDSTIVIKNPTETLKIVDAPGSVPQDDLSKSYSALQLLYRADEVLRDIGDFKQLLENFMTLIIEVIPADRGYIFLINRENGMPVPYVRHPGGVLEGDAEIVVSKTILQTAVKQKESLISNDALVDERFVHSKSVANLKVRSAMCAPLLNRGKVLGVIYLDSTDQSNLFVEDDLALLSAMALKAGIALDNARLYDDMRNLLINTVETLVRAIQARDPYTSGHSVRVTRYALQIGARLGIGTTDQHHLYLAAMLHDIGKIGIPDDLLNRPGRLNEAEIATVREHVKLGANMLRALGEMHPIVPLILHHHEAWNGSGYPDGLKGEKIPLISRILSVADSFDAMTSDRPYRQALLRTEAIDELKRCRGTTYEPKIVDVFLEVLENESTDVIDIELEGMNQEAPIEEPAPR